jgi:acetylornithine deacetylase/succinyl-diaminopimelate desuccinylase-like protein
MITEGDEESGSIHMNHYLPKLKERIGNPKIFFCLDSGAIDYDRLWLSASLRGNLVGTLKVSTMRDGVHSGDSSGVVPNCYRIAKILLNRI